MGATYDLFGNGRTALKVTLNKYLEGLGTTGALSPTCRTAESDQPAEHQTTRPWTDNGRATPTSSRIATC